MKYEWVFLLLQFQNACRHLESLLEELQQKVEQLQQAQSVTGDETLHRKVQELTTLLQGSLPIFYGQQLKIWMLSELSGCIFDGT